MKGDSMGINLGNAIYQANKLNNNGAKLSEIKRDLESFKGVLNANWKGTEMGYINSALDTLVNELQSVSQELKNLGNDVEQIAREIREEEKAKERAEAEARAKALEEAKARMEVNP